MCVCVCVCRPLRVKLGLYCIIYYHSNEIYLCIILLLINYLIFNKKEMNLIDYLVKLYHRSIDCW